MPTELMTPLPSAPPRFSTPFVFSSSNLIARKLYLWRLLFEATARGQQTVAAVSGLAGVGKTTIIIEILTRLRIPYERVSTRRAFIEAAWRLREGGVIIVEDADHVVLHANQNNGSFLKACLDDGPTRWIDNDTVAARKSLKDDEVDVIPLRFETKAVLAWSSNPGLGGASKTMEPHVAALRDRGCNPIVIPEDRLVVLEFVLHHILDNGLINLIDTGERVKPTASRAEIQDVINYLCKNVWRFHKPVSLRMAKTAIKNRRLYKAEWEEMSEGWLAQTPVSSAAPPTPPRFLTAKERKDAGLPPMGKPTPKLEWPKNLTREELAVQRAQEEAAAAERRTAEAARLTSDSPNVTEPAEDVTGEPHASTCGDELSIIADDADKEVVDDIVDGDDDPETNPPQRRGRPSRTSAELAEGTDGDSSVDIDDDEGDGPIVDPLGLPDEVTPEDTKGRQTTIECGARR